MTTRRPDKLTMQADTLLQKYTGGEKKGSRLVCVHCPLTRLKGSIIQFNVSVLAEVLKRLGALGDKRLG